MWTAKTAVLNDVPKDVHFQQFQMLAFTQFCAWDVKPQSAVSSNHLPHVNATIRKWYAFEGSCQRVFLSLVLAARLGCFRGVTMIQSLRILHLGLAGFCGA